MKYFVEIFENKQIFIKLLHLFIYYIYYIYLFIIFIKLLSIIFIKFKSRISDV